MPLTIYCTQKFPHEALELLRQGAQHHHLVIASRPNNLNLHPGEADAALASADIAFGQPDVATAMASQRLRWIHLTTAGYERYAGDEFSAALQSRGATMTNSSGVYAEPVAQHVVGLILMLARQLPWSIENQRAAREWPAAPIRAASRLLTGQTAVILGYGAIARRLVELLTPFGMTIVAVRTRPRGDEAVRTVGEAEVESVLGLADHVINTLPGGEKTREFVSATRLAAMKRSAIFYNVGRGTTVDQQALLQALNGKHLAAACLDVTEPEPLPPDHPLWTARNCYITPHTAGGHGDEQLRIVSHFLANLRRYESNQPLIDRVW